MIRRAFRMKVHPGQAEEYERRHSRRAEASMERPSSRKSHGRKPHSHSHKKHSD